jgi:hypothetical protein
MVSTLVRYPEQRPRALRYPDGDFCFFFLVLVRGGPPARVRIR